MPTASYYNPFHKQMKFYVRVCSDPRTSSELILHYSLGIVRNTFLHPKNCIFMILYASIVLYLKYFFLQIDTSWHILQFEFTFLIMEALFKVFQIKSHVSVDLISLVYCSISTTSFNPKIVFAVFIVTSYSMLHSSKVAFFWVEEHKNLFTT